MLTSWTKGLHPDQMREVDRLAEADYGLGTMMLMEVAGLCAARVARDLLATPLGGRAVSILAGPGNNGGDGLVAARRLAGWGAEVSVITSYDLDQVRGASDAQLEATTAAGVPASAWSGELTPADLYIDALLGYGASGAPRGAIAEIIAALNRAGQPVLALDVPSGLDAATGWAEGEAVVATATITLGLAKSGLLMEQARSLVGVLYLGDIGIPRPLLASLGVDVEGLFEEDDIVKLV